MSSSHVLRKLKGRMPFSPFVRNFAWYSFVFASWVPALIFFNANVGEVAGVGGESMYPYLNPAFHEGLSKDICWISKRRPAKGLQRGMVVTFWSPAHPEVLSIKRVIALPGDQVLTKAPYPYPTAVIPSNHVWVEGDNTDGRKTLDSNYYGPISMGLITGRATHILRPWKGQVRWWEFQSSTRVIKGQVEQAPNFD